MRRSQPQGSRWTSPGAERSGEEKAGQDCPGERGGRRVAPARKTREHLIQGEEESCGERQQRRPGDAAGAGPHDDQDTKKAQDYPNPSGHTHALAQDGSGEGDHEERGGEGDHRGVRQGHEAQAQEHGGAGQEGQSSARGLQERSLATQQA